MKGKLCILTTLFVVLSLILTVQVKAADFSWKDDFNYGSLQQMQNAGWDLANPSGTRLESDGVVLDGTKVDTSINYLNHFPAGIYNWTIEIRALWLGHGHSQPAIYVGTERHNYGFVADGWGSQYGLYRDGASPITFGSYKEQANTWVTLRMEKQANIISMYCNGVLVNVYSEQDTRLSQLTGFSTVSPWRGDEKYDYVQVSSSVTAPSPTTSSGFPVFYVAVGGGIAAAVVGGAAVYWFLFAGKTAASAAGSAGAAGSVESVEGQTKEVAFLGEVTHATGEVLKTIENDLGTNQSQDAKVGDVQELLKNPQVEKPELEKLQLPENKLQKINPLYNEKPQAPEDQGQTTQEAADSGESSGNADA